MVGRMVREAVENLIEDVKDSIEQQNQAQANRSRSSQPPAWMEPPTSGGPSVTVEPPGLPPVSVEVEAPVPVRPAPQPPVDPAPALAPAAPAADDQSPSAVDRPDADPSEHVEDDTDHVPDLLVAPDTPAAVAELEEEVAVARDLYREARQELREARRLERLAARERRRARRDERRSGGRQLIER